MKKIILKRHPEKKNLYEIINSIFHKVFKERVLIANKNGKFTYYRFSPALQSICFLLFFGMIYWTLFTTRIYLLNVDTLKNKDTQIIDARNKFNKVVADINAYKDTISEINKKLEISNNNIVNLLEKDEKLTKLEKDTLVKNRLLLSTELNYANDKLNSFAKGITWANIDTKEPYYRTTKNELERNVVLNENVYLKKQNNTLEKTLSDMKQLQDNLINKVQILADNNINDIENVLSKVDIVLSQVHLKNRNNLIKKVQQEDGEGLGGKYIPLKNIDLIDEDLDLKFKNANLKVNLWEGLSKAKTMLPLGAPVKKIRITSPFGIRPDPFFKTPAMHTGIDFGGKEGTPLYATSAGKVIQAGPRGDYGLAVEVDHGLGFTTLYGHLSKITVQKGDIIEEGTKVGLAGSTGRSTGPHLHYELRHNSHILNPYAFIKVENK
ncbi:MAG: peptidoglycan DD-metalloendopeptidase family protein [Alphaproteobacteria bacterium]|nr:peptidoglycan DD-metalloendopeptidase family protein [Alphaproteobacteria bacterium]